MLRTRGSEYRHTDTQRDGLDRGWRVRRLYIRKGVIGRKFESRDSVLLRRESRAHAEVC